MLVATGVAIVVSTADSYLLAPATSMVRDVYQRFMRPNASERIWFGSLGFAWWFWGLGALGLAFMSIGFFDVALFAVHDLRVRDYAGIVGGFVFASGEPAGGYGGFVGGGRGCVGLGGDWVFPG